MQFNLGEVLQLCSAVFFFGGVVYMVRAQKEALDGVMRWLRKLDARVDTHETRLAVMETVCESRHPRG